jgi:hypothetical protein
MKTLIILFAVLAATPSFAQDNGKLPICNMGKDTELAMPCKLPALEASQTLADMMFSNRKGFNEIADKAPGAKEGMTGGFMIESSRVSFLKEATVDSHGHMLTTSTLQYEVILNDCRGTDVCNGNYLWTVTEVAHSDGYSYYSEFTNDLAKTSLTELK